MINSPEPLLIVAGEQNSVLDKFPAASPLLQLRVMDSGVEMIHSNYLCTDHRKKITEK